MGLPLIQAYPFKLGAQTAAQQAAMSRLNANKTQNDMTNISKGGRKYKIIRGQPINETWKHLVCQKLELGKSQELSRNHFFEKKKLSSYDTFQKNFLLGHISKKLFLCV